MASPDSERENAIDEKTTQSDASNRWTVHVTKEFNVEVKRAVDGAIYGIVGQDVLRALYKHLKEHCDLTPDEIPYRLDSVFETLEQTFGVKGARTYQQSNSQTIVL